MQGCGVRVAENVLKLSDATRGKKNTCIRVNIRVRVGCTGIQRVKESEFESDAQEIKESEPG